MKVKSFLAPGLLVATIAQGRTILRGCSHILRERKWLGLATFCLALAIGAFILPYDRSLLNQLHFWSASQEKVAHNIAWYLSTWGDYPTYNVPLALVIWLYGVWSKSSAWRRIAVVCFLGATLAGLFNDCFRLTLGRPRPDTHLQDGFYGIAYAMRGGYQSFPSGHAASVLGAAVALLVTEFPLGLIATAFALAVCWARMELYRHYPSDVAVGAVIGVYFGLLVGFAAKLRLSPRQ